jgi:hypothetical protein
LVFPGFIIPFNHAVIEQTLGYYFFYNTTGITQSPAIKGLIVVAKLHHVRLPDTLIPFLTKMALTFPLGVRGTIGTDLPLRVRGINGHGCSERPCYFAAVLSMYLFNSSLNV